MLALLLAACSATPEREDHALLLGAGTFVDQVGAGIGGALRDGTDPAEVTGMVSSRWEGEVPVTLAWVEESPELCDGCVGGVWDVTLSLDAVPFLGDPYAEDADRNFDCPEDVAWSMGRCDTDRGFDFTPGRFTLTGTLAARLDVRYRDEYDARVWVDASTPAPATLTARGLWIDRTADVTVVEDATWDEYGEDTDVRGTVDGVAYQWDVNTTD